ncbi:MAG TPA: PHB depolymerase family esterase [Thermoleophilaceae bacterium]
MPSRSHLRSRPSADARAALPPGLTPLGLGAPRDGLLHVPEAGGATPTPLVVLLHGAGSSASAAIPILADLAEEHGVALLAPDSRGSTWDVIRGGFGPDVEFIDSALEHVFARWPVDPARVAVGGFSDGASYALSLGIGNGDLFTHVIAFSPGFAAPAARVGRPRMYLTHGTHDRVLPIDRCSRRLVPLFEAGEYDVTYEEFDGGHTVPAELAGRAVAWLSAG